MKVVVEVKITSTDQMKEAFKENDDKYREWTIFETLEKKVGKAVMVPLIVSHEGSIHKDTVRRWKNFAPDVMVYWVRITQGVLRFNVVIVGNSSTRGAGSPRRGEKNTRKEFAEQEPPERMTAAERREMLPLDRATESAVSVRSSGTPPQHSARLTSTGRGNLNLEKKPTYQRKTQLDWLIGLPVVSLGGSPSSRRQPNAVWRWRARRPHTHRALGY